VRKEQEENQRGAKANSFSYYFRQILTAVPEIKQSVI
jgi:hypothetical protein